MSNSRSPICHEIGKNDMIGVVVIAIITLIVGIWQFYQSASEISYLNSEEGQEYMEICEEILDYPHIYDDESVSIAEEYMAIDSFCRKLDTIDMILYGGIAVMAVLMLLRVRIAFKLSLVLYILATVTYVIYSIFFMFHSDFEGAADSLQGGIFIVIVRIAVIKMLVGMVIATSGKNAAPAAPAYVAPVGNVPLTPTERTNPTLDPVTGQQTTASAMPAMLQKNPQTAPQPVHSSAQMQSVAPISAPQPVAAPQSAVPTAQAASAPSDWQCRGCGFMNAANNTTCAFCGTNKE